MSWVGHYEYEYSQSVSDFASSDIFTFSKQSSILAHDTNTNLELVVIVIQIYSGPFPMPARYIACSRSQGYVLILDNAVPYNTIKETKN